MKRPSRGARESATTTRYDGRRERPARLSRMQTTVSPPRHGKRWQPAHLAELAAHALELPHHLPELRVLLEQPVHVLHVRPATPRDALTPAPVDDLGMRALGGSHGGDDGVEAAEVGGLVVHL